MKTSLEVRPPLPPLPVEIILQVVANLVSPDRSDNPEWNERATQYDLQRTLHACSLVNHTWYDAVVEELYRYPRLTSRNYDHFVRTICPSVNLHVRKSELASLVRVLDLRQLVFAGTKSLVARLLGRVKENLETLKAPQTSFAINSLAALSKCRRLSSLDMSFVTESIPFDDFFITVEKIPTLESLSLPRSSLAEARHGHSNLHTLKWPSKLAKLSLPSAATSMLCAHDFWNRLKLDRLDLALHPRHQGPVLRFLRVHLKWVDHLCLYGMGTDMGKMIYHFLMCAPVRHVRTLSFHNLGHYNPFEDFSSILDTARDPPSHLIFISDPYQGDDGEGAESTELTVSPDEPGNTTVLDTALCTDRWPRLEEITLGPHDEALHYSVAGEEMLNINAMIYCLRFRFEKAWPGAQPAHYIRRIFLYFKTTTVTEMQPSIIEELTNLSELLIELEKARVKRRQDEEEAKGGVSDGGYRAREAGVFLFQCAEGQDPDVQKQHACPVSDPAEHFDAETLRGWPHAGNWESSSVRRLLPD